MSRDRDGLRPLVSRRPVASLAPALKEEMYRLFAAHYDAVTEQIFLRDLQAKDVVVLLHDIDDTLTGFAVFQFLFPVTPFRCQVVYSGDIIVRPDYWGRHDLLRAAFELAGYRKARFPELPLFWCVTIKGVKTWRLLPLNFHSFWPNADTPCPSTMLQLRNNVGAEKFGVDFDPDTGIVWSGQSVGHLASAIAHTPMHQRSKPEVQFFLELNPGYLQGYELFCIAPAELENFRPVARRWFRTGLEITDSSYL